MSDGGITVSGGTGGLSARLEDLDRLGQLSMDMGGDLAALSARLHGTLVDPDVVASAVLDPAGFAAFETAMLAALDGPGGITALGVSYGAFGFAVQTSVAGYRAVDTLSAASMDAIEWFAGFQDGPLLPLLADPGFVGGMLKEGLWDMTFGDGSFDWQLVLTEHPGVIDGLIGVSPGMLTRLGLPALTPQHAAGWLGLVYPDTGGKLTVKAPEKTDGFFAGEGHEFERLFDSLEDRNQSGGDGADQGEIDVKVVPQSDGTNKYIVMMPGTKSWQPNPFGDNPYANDLSTNLHGMAGDSTVYERMVAQALKEAGADPGADVMLVGHSQGGIVAAGAAQHSGSDAFPYHVTHVVTAGSPVANFDIPEGTQMLSFENTHDIVPHLDGHENPDRPNVTTVTFDKQTGSVSGNHGLTDKSYLWAAQQADGMDDPSLTAWRESAAGYFEPADEPSTLVYQLTRK